jgi:hypothetical protein
MLVTIAPQARNGSGTVGRNAATHHGTPTVSAPPTRLRIPTAVAKSAVSEFNVCAS